MRKAKGYTGNDLVNIALFGKDMSIKKGLQTYANPDNWTEFYDKEHSIQRWVWNGPTGCGYEHASQCLKYDRSANASKTINHVPDGRKKVK